MFFFLAGDKIKNRGERQTMQVECLLGLGHWDRASVMLAEMVQGVPDQWSYIRQYIVCQIKRCQLKRRAFLEAKKAGVGCEGGSEGCGGEEGEELVAVGKEVTGKEEEGVSTSAACKQEGECGEVCTWGDLM